MNPRETITDDRIFGDRGPREVAEKRARRWFGLGEFQSLDPALEQKDGRRAVYWTRVWVATGAFYKNGCRDDGLTEPRHFWCRPCRVGRDRKPGAQICSWDNVRLEHGIIYHPHAIDRQRGVLDP